MPTTSGNSEKHQPDSGHVIVVGSLNVDYVVRTPWLPLPGETVAGGALERYPGGKSNNQAVAAAAHDASIWLVGAVGGDDGGAFLRRNLEHAGVSTTDLIEIESESTGTAVIAVDDHGQNTIIISAGANGALSAGHVHSAAVFDPKKPGQQAEESEPSRSTVVCLCFEVSDHVISAAAHRARELEMTTVLNPSPYREIDLELLRQMDVIVINEIETEQLTGFHDDVMPGSEHNHVEDVGRRLRRLGLKDVVITLGARGALVLESAGDWIRAEHVPALEVDVVDTTGCGDTFVGALASRMAMGDPLTEATRYAVVAAGLAATEPGAQTSPDAETVLAYLSTVDDSL